MGIFYPEKAFHAGKKIRKNDFAPSEKYACYANAWGGEGRHSSILRGKIGMPRPDFQTWRLRNEFFRESNLQILEILVTKCMMVFGTESFKIVHSIYISWAKICHVCCTRFFLILEWKLFFSNWKRTPETENVKNWRIPNFVWGLKCLWISLFSHSILISNSISILFYSILFYSILFYSILFYSILFYSILALTELSIYFLVSEKVYF